ncbi:hypothetical protein FTO74_10800 [Granulicella sp. WH15]|uniref:hypothetical protein n=1 Tax=Granulicella sp. WH15 TaxID=2602070 RepID=UPI0013669FD3|nr:hypothetical protein [Granulicella sp. WH15]QHN03807.1 hypothetical protein FTO74_10800 [Granulicella sp. WH15]
MMPFDVTRNPVLPADLIRAYLESTGWRLQQNLELPALGAEPKLLAKRWGAAKKYDVFYSGLQNPVELIIPRDPQTSDYQQRVQDVLRTLEAVEDRSRHDIATEILFINFDLLKSAIPNSYLTYDAIPLQSAVEHVGNLQELLASSATTQISPKAFYGRVRKAAVEYSERCLFGHTFKGSFGFTVQSPLLIETSQTKLFELDVPFERKVLARLVNGLESIREAQKENNLDVALNPESGLSANGFDVLAKLIEEAGGQVSLEVAFSRRWQRQTETARVESFEFSSQTIEVSREAADKLRATYKPVLKTVVGRVINLRNTTDPSRLMQLAKSRDVVIDFEDEDLGDIKVKVTLNASDYLRAVEAHKVGQRIAVDGLLERSGLRYMIQNPTQLRTL